MTITAIAGVAPFLEILNLNQGYRRWAAVASQDNAASGLDVWPRQSRLFLTQLALNAGFGLVVGAGLWFIGVPSAPLWGMLAMILRFVPYVGALISAIFPLVLAAGVSATARICTKTTGLIFPARLQGSMDHYRSARPFALNALTTAEPSLTAMAASGIDQLGATEASGLPCCCMANSARARSRVEAVPGDKFKPLVLGHFRTGADTGWYRLDQGVVDSRVVPDRGAYCRASH